MSMVAYMSAVAFQEEPYLLQQRPRRAPLGGYRHLPDHWRGTAPGLMNRIADAGALGRGRWGSNSMHTRLFRNSLSGPAAGHHAVALVQQIIHDARLSRSKVAGRYEPLCVVGVYGAAIAHLEAGNVF